MVIVSPCPGTITLTPGNSLFIFSINLSTCTLPDIGGKESSKWVDQCFDNELAVKNYMLSSKDMDS